MAYASFSVDFASERKEHRSTHAHHPYLLHGGFSIFPPAHFAPLDPVLLACVEETGSAVYLAFGKRCLWRRAVAPSTDPLAASTVLVRANKSSCSTSCTGSRRCLGGETPARTTSSEPQHHTVTTAHVHPSLRYVSSLLTTLLFKGSGQPTQGTTVFLSSFLQTKKWSISMTTAWPPNDKAEGGRPVVNQFGTDYALDGVTASSQGKMTRLNSEDEPDVAVFRRVSDASHRGFVQELLLPHESLTFGRDRVHGYSAWLVHRIVRLALLLGPTQESNSAPATDADFPTIPRTCGGPRTTAGLSPPQLIATGLSAPTSLFTSAPPILHRRRHKTSSTRWTTAAIRGRTNDRNRSLLVRHVLQLAGKLRKGARAVALELLPQTRTSLGRGRMINTSHFAVASTVQSYKRDCPNNDDLPPTRNIDGWWNSRRPFPSLTQASYNTTPHVKRLSVYDDSHRTRYNTAKDRPVYLSPHYQIIIYVLASHREAGLLLRDHDKTASLAALWPNRFPIFAVVSRPRPAAPRDT
ncbi:hypothetical protein BV25DRAFT_1838259 [Artomyces pyxidatus]|uniref:Uncharacterized protein n=1 Tax=Artomyces pyxidatus TaxID=48021 RepID=A0ACB8T1Y8_9AGAM|nr:hypothetical protein BV25DRAFT_1838259 [Artomyces pyxidatus]